MSALRAPWYVAAVVAVAALPILGITTYLTLGEIHGLNLARSERAGLRQIAPMSVALFDLSELSREMNCATGSPAQERALVRRIDGDLASASAAAPFASPAWTQARRAWSALRPLTDKPALDPVIQPIQTAIMNLSDRSGLTFDAQVVTVDLGDALTYRLPEAAASLQHARRTICAAGTAPTLARRLSVESANSRAQTLLADATVDLSDALSQRDAPKGRVPAAYARSQQLNAIASAGLERFAAAKPPADSQHALIATNAAILALHDLMQAEIPEINAMNERRIADYRRRILLFVLQGIAAVAAAVVIALLMTRLVWQQAALAAAQRSAAENEDRAAHDPMTGLLNRRAFFTSGSSEGILCIVDLDNLKQINDAYGHLTGDDVIVHVARIVQGCVRSTDAVARLGGDEFAIFLRAPIQRDAVDRILDEITRAVRQPVEVRGRTIRASVSVGAAPIAANATLEETFAVADAALYDAKRTARGSVVYRTPDAGFIHGHA